MSVGWYYNMYSTSDRENKSSDQTKRDHKKIIQLVIDFLRTKNKGEFIKGQEILDYLRSLGIICGNLSILHRIIRKSSCLEEISSERVTYWVLDINVWNKDNSPNLIS